jgi:hypothetical protein
MIETKEQYEELKKDAQQNWNDMHDRGIFKTIEALRKVARAAKPVLVRLQLLQKIGPVGESPKWTQDLADAVDDLPEWLKDG